MNAQQSKLSPIEKPNESIKNKKSTLLRTQRVTRSERCLQLQAVALNFRALNETIHAAMFRATEDNLLVILTAMQTAVHAFA